MEKHELKHSGQTSNTTILVVPLQQKVSFKIEVTPPNASINRRTIEANVSKALSLFQDGSKERWTNEILMLEKVREGNSELLHTAPPAEHYTNISQIF